LTFDHSKEGEEGGRKEGKKGVDKVRVAHLRVDVMRCEL
jgi:hypothetical protein